MLPIVFLAIYLFALLILRVLNAAPLFRCHFSVGHRRGFHALHALLAFFKTGGFLWCQRAGFDALIDTLLLIRLALIDPGRGRRAALRYSEA
ncbi:MAG: hypothetical protein ACXWCY_03030 [Burkholderiales bacterium]